MLDEPATKKLIFWGPKGVVFLPILLAIISLIYIARLNANIPAYWAAFLLPLLLALFLAKDKAEYCESILRGITNHVGGILIMAVLLAGISGAIISKSGVIDSMATYIIGINFVGNKFVVATFLITCVIAFSTGTSVGTMFVIGPILYPIGYLVGGTPAYLIGAIISGSAFGDNISPVSDTLIAGATTQNVELGKLFKSRIKYTIPVMLLCTIAYAFLGSGGEAHGLDAIPAEANAISLLFLLIPVTIVAACLLHRHLLEAFTYGIIVGLVIGLVTGIFTFNDIISVPEPFGAGGLIVDGIGGSIPTVVVIMLMFAHISILQDGGGIHFLINSMERFVVGPRSAEAAIAIITILLNIATALNTAAIMGTAPLAYELGERYGLDGYRRSNIMINSGATFNYLMPYMVPVVLGSMFSSSYAPVEGATVVSTFEVIFSQIYPWAMLAMLAFAITTGYGRTFLPDNKGEGAFAQSPAQK